MKDSIDLEKLKEKINNIDYLQKQAISSLNDMNNIIIRNRKEFYFMEKEKCK